MDADLWRENESLIMKLPELDTNECGFTTTLPVWVLCRPHRAVGTDWREVDQGPGVIRLPQGEEASLRIKNLDDDLLAQLVHEIKGCAAITGLNLSENRNITDEGLAHLVFLPQLTYLNLSSCALTNHGFLHLLALPLLQYLDLSYCNRITDTGVKQLKALCNLAYLNLQGCVKVSNGSISKLRRNGLTIHARGQGMQ
jgi:hypothetical protein